MITGTSSWLRFGLLLAVVCCSGATEPQSFNVTPAGGQVTLEGGRVVLNFPAGAVAEPTTFTATPLASPPGTTVVPGSAYDVQPAAALAKSVQLIVLYEQSAIPAGIRESELGIFKLLGVATWSQVAGSAVDTVQNTLTASLTSFGTVAVLWAPVASVELAPSPAAVAIGATVQITATARDAAGAVLSGRSGSWTSSAPAVAGVSPSGLVSGLTAGTATISATIESIEAQTTVTVSGGSPPSVDHPNEPAGYTMIRDVNFNTTNLGSGWGYSSKWTDTAFTRVVADTFQSAARPSDPNVIQFTFPVGFLDATQPPLAEFLGIAPRTEMYVSYWLKVSNPWQYHQSGVNKLFFFATNGTSNLDNEMVCALVGNAEATAQFVCGVQSPQNGGFPGSGAGGYYTANIAQPGLSLGVWHHIEVRALRSTGGQANGVIEWWVDGVLTGRHTGVLFKSTGDSSFDGFHINPNWGGFCNCAKTQRDFLWVDHWYVSGKP